MAVLAPLSPTSWSRSRSTRRSSTSPAARARWATATTIARRLKDAIRDETQLTASVGVADLEARGQDRLRHAQAGRARRRGAGDGGRVPRAAAGAPAVGRGAEDGGAAGEARRRRRSATSPALDPARLERRLRHPRPRPAAARARRGRAAGVGGSRRRPRASARSTPTTGTPPTATRLRATLLDARRRGRGAAARPRPARAHGHAEVPRRGLPDHDPRADAARADGLRRSALFDDGLGAVRRGAPRAAGCGSSGSTPRTSARAARSSSCSTSPRGPRRSTGCATRSPSASASEAITRASLLGRRERRNPSDKPPR